MLPNIAYAKTIAILTAPAFPHVARAGSTALKLTWSREPGVSGYEIYRAAGSSSKFTKVKTINSSRTVSWVNKKLKTDKKYTYKLRSFIKDGEGKRYSGFTYTISAVPYSKGSKIVNAGKDLQGSDSIEIGIKQEIKLDVKTIPSSFGTAKKKKAVDPTIRIIITDPLVSNAGKGVIIGEKAGSTIIYALAHNGNVKKINVEVVDYLNVSGEWMYEDDEEFFAPVSGILLGQKDNLLSVYSYFALSDKVNSIISLSGGAIWVTGDKLNTKGVIGSRLTSLLSGASVYEKRLIVNTKGGWIALEQKDMAKKQISCIYYDIQSDGIPGFFSDDDCLIIAPHWSICRSGLDDGLLTRQVVKK